MALESIRSLCLYCNIKCESAMGPFACIRGAGGTIMANTCKVIIGPVTLDVLSILKDRVNTGTYVTLRLNCASKVRDLMCEVLCIDTTLRKYV
jgi:hypothetical protein